MLLTCPHCRIVQAEGNETCINCGRSPADHSASPYGDPSSGDLVHALQARRTAWWLPPVIAVGLLLALTASAFLVVRRSPAGHTAAPQVADDVPALQSSAPQPAPVPPAPEVAMAAKTAVKRPPKVPIKATPLSVALTSSGQGRHVRVGQDVTFTALARGRSATLTLFYRRGLGPKTMHSFTEGGLLSTTWTPSAPGRYGFTVIALGDHRRAAASRPVEITVDAPAARMEARGGAAQAPPDAALAPLPPWPVRLPPLPRPPRVMPLKAAALEAAVPHVPPPVAPPAPAMPYHVAAAQFPSSRSAVVLAKAFRLRGSPATTKRMIGYHGKTVYAVVTGAYRRPEEARAAVLVLQRSGYPAYLFGSRQPPPGREVRP